MIMRLVELWTPDCIAVYEESLDYISYYVGDLRDKKLGLEK